MSDVALVAAPATVRTVSWRAVPAVTAAVVVATATLAVWSLTLGDYPISMLDALGAALGEGPPSDLLVIRTWRLPRLLAALMAGVAFGCSGALLQALVRNPLASPDVIGINMGGTTAAVAFIVLGLPGALVPAAALVGTLASAALLAVLAFGRRLDHERLVLIGIGVQTGLYAVKTFLVVRFPDEVVQAAVLWTVGTLYGRAWIDVAVGGAGLVLLVPAAFVLLRRLGILELGDELAGELGLGVRLSRLLVLGTVVGLAAVGVSLGGPLPFVALAVPLVARMIGGPLTGSTLLLAASGGALLLLAADLVAQYALPTALPAGVVTSTVGAPFFFWLLWRQRRGFR